MRIPFIPKVSERSDLGVEPAQFRFIADSRGGSAFLLAGACFWWAGALFSLLVPDRRVDWLLYAGFAVPFLGVLFARLQGARLFGDLRFATLAGIATLTELAALPTMFLLRNTQPEALPAILSIADGAHLVILMWLHLDYSYFLAGNAKIVLGLTFLFTELWADSYPPQLAVGGAVSLLAGILVWRDSTRTASLYIRT